MAKNSPYEETLLLIRTSEGKRFGAFISKGKGEVERKEGKGEERKFSFLITYFGFSFLIFMIIFFIIVSFFLHSLETEPSILWNWRNFCFFI